ncbi:MAG: TIGR02206 family membrane protein [Candidatus Marinimicrobia bacterium]|nr:TIGR02206 family membrane protein [Candidatus Neomarinimicrobiota bacterium]MDP6593398.1 TIGR02206 family membrane protein [Candidatus Neomarinimicrobiota bacterium]MDP6837239.1 TIGR02206 family membrane protein [Candidatus Neomarinimicrobiota bacterium]MDP6967199.1 TIGR02206 family membrane protein [Candidatus Neomarinimicrobiota bacterium]
MTPHETIPIFSDPWWWSNGVTVAAIAAVIVMGKRLSLETRERFGRALGIILLARWVLYHPYLMWLGHWNVQSNLPLHMCGFSSLLSGLVLLWRNQWGYELLYYWGFPGAFHALLTPEFTSGRDGLLHYEYFFSHGGILASALFLTLICGMKPRCGSWWRIVLLTQPVLVIIGIANWFLDANYMYLCQPPVANNPFIIGQWPWYIVGLEVAGLLHLLLVYSPFGLKYYKAQVTSAKGVPERTSIE